MFQGRTGKAGVHVQICGGWRVSQRREGETNKNPSRHRGELKNSNTIILESEIVAGSVQSELQRANEDGKEDGWGSGRVPHPKFSRFSLSKARKKRSKNEISFCRNW